MKNINRRKFVKDSMAIAAFTTPFILKPSGLFAAPSEDASLDFCQNKNELTPDFISA